MKAATNLINQALCIEYNNAPASNNFFTVVETGSSGRFYNTLSYSLNSTLVQATSGSIAVNSLLYAKITSRTDYYYI